VIFLNDGPGLLLGSMWRDSAYIETIRGRISLLTVSWGPADESG